MKQNIRRLCAAMALVCCLSMQPLSLADDEDLTPSSPKVQEPNADEETPVAETEAKSSETDVLPADSSQMNPALSVETEAAPQKEGTSSEPSPSAAVEETKVPEITISPDQSVEPTSEPSAKPTEEPMSTPSIEPTDAPSAEPTEETTVEPSAEPTDEATVEPSAEPTDEATVEPSAEPTDEAAGEPSAEPTEETTPEPEESPIPEEDQTPSEDESFEDDAEVEIAPRNPYSGWHGVVPSDEQGMAIPMVFQTDYPEIVCTIRGIGRSVATSGCGATSLSMVVAYLTGNTEQTPYTIFCDAVDLGMYYGNGFSHETISYFAEQYGVQGKWIGRDADAILEALHAGKPVIAHMGSGIFTSNGHYVVLRGVTEDGLILLNDPASPRKCKKAFPIETLLTQSKSDHPFMICWTEELTEESAEEAAADAPIEMAALNAELVVETPQPTEAPEPQAIAETDGEQALQGDLNESGSVDMNDAQLLYDLINGMYQDDPQQDALLARSDFNGDGQVNVADLRQMVAEIRGDLPSENVNAEEDSQTDCEAATGL